MRSWMIVCAAVLLTTAACKKKDCPAASPCPPATECPKGDGGVAAEVKASTYTLVEAENGNRAMVTTTADGKVLVIPIDAAKIRVFEDGKVGTGNPYLLGPGSCPCRLPVCLPFCRPAAPTMEIPPKDFYGYDVAPAPAPGDPTPAPAPGGEAPPAPAPQ